MMRFWDLGRETEDAMPGKRRRRMYQTGEVPDFSAWPRRYQLIYGALVIAFVLAAMFLAR